MSQQVRTMGLPLAVSSETVPPALRTLRADDCCARAGPSETRRDEIVTRLPLLVAAQDSKCPGTSSRPRHADHLEPLADQARPGLH